MNKISLESKDEHMLQNNHGLKQAVRLF